MPAAQEMSALQPGEARDLLKTVVFFQYGLEAAEQALPRFRASLAAPGGSFLEALAAGLDDGEVIQLANTAADHTQTGLNITVRDTDGTPASVNWSGTNKQKFIEGLRYRLGGYARKLHLPYYKEHPDELKEEKLRTIEEALAALGHVPFRSVQVVRELIDLAELAAKEQSSHQRPLKTITI